ncbi:right-handed parallel beta-helix repeat-containing protein [Psychroserpens sp.]
MKRILYFLITISILVFWSSCRKDFDFSPSNGDLSFSKDTIYLDTVFADIGSSTYNLKVYNRSDDDISIPSLRLSQGENSNYRLNVDGMAGKVFENIELLAKDSLFIFIETTYNTNGSPLSELQFLDTDAIEFDSGNNLQKVELVTLIKDAIFIFPDRDNTTNVIETLTFDVDGDGMPDETTLQGRFLEDDELTFTNEKPYVIYGFAAVDEGDVLTIEAGARVHFHANSGLLVTNNASLKVNGALSDDQELLENEVIFEGDRLEPLYENIPGQWSTIYLFDGSVNNEINYATIKNSTIGVLCELDQDAPNNKLTITNSQIYNSSNFGILARASSVRGENLVINNSGQSSFAGTIGGKYNFTHCTFANYWNTSFRQFPSVLLNNFVINADNSVTTNNLEEANFNNCIIYGNDNAEIDISGESSSDLVFKFTDCLIRFEVSQNPFNFNDGINFERITLNQNPGFKSPFENDLRLDESSQARGIGNSIFTNQVLFDILGVQRPITPEFASDLGAYQFVPSED